MIPGDYPLKLYRGDSAKWRFVVWQDPNKTQPADLTDVDAAAQMRDTAGGTLIFDFVCDVVQPNFVDVAIPASLWPPTGPTKAVWDLQLTYPTGDVATILAGKVSITQDVTIADNTVPLSVVEVA